MTPVQRLQAAIDKLETLKERHTFLMTFASTAPGVPATPDSYEPRR